MIFTVVVKKKLEPASAWKWCPACQELPCLIPLHTASWPPALGTPTAVSELQKHKTEQNPYQINWDVHDHPEDRAQMQIRRENLREPDSAQSWNLASFPWCGLTWTTTSVSPLSSRLPIAHFRASLLLSEKSTATPIRRASPIFSSTFTSSSFPTNLKIAAFFVNIS